MPDDTEKKNAKQAKIYVLHNMPSWLFTSQIWISDGARPLLQAMVRRADGKTGNLLIPAKGSKPSKWIHAKTIEREAGMCTRLRKQYMKELKELGFVRWERVRVNCIIGKRKRVVLGETHYTVLFHNITNPRKHAGSSTVPPNRVPKQPNDNGLEHNSEQPKPNTDKASSMVPSNETINSPIEHKGSSTVPESKNHAENTPIDSSTVPSGNRSPKEPTSTSDFPSSSRVASVSGFDIRSESHVHQGGVSSPLQNPKPKAPPTAVIPEYHLPPQAQECVDSLRRLLRIYQIESKPLDLSVFEMQRKFFLEQTGALAIPFKHAVALYEQTVRDFLNPQADPLPEPPKPTAPVADEPNRTQTRKHADWYDQHGSSPRRSSNPASVTAEDHIARLQRNSKLAGLDYPEETSPPRRRSSNPAAVTSEDHIARARRNAKILGLD